MRDHNTFKTLKKKIQGKKGNLAVKDMKIFAQNTSIGVSFLLLICMLKMRLACS